MLNLNLIPPLGPTSSLQEIQWMEEQVKHHHKEAISQTYSQGQRIQFLQQVNGIPKMWEWGRVLNVLV